MLSLSPWLTSCAGAICFLSNIGYFIHQDLFSLHTSLITGDTEARSCSRNITTTLIFSTPAQHVSIHELLAHPQDYHQELISIRGMITQPELHLDDTELYADFVFRLVEGTRFIIVYGRHDRTLGPSAIRMQESVEVIGRFFVEQERNGVTLEHVLEAISVTPFPSSIPEST